MSYSFPTNPTVSRTFTLSGGGGMGSGPWLISGTGYNANTANLQVRRGTTERWTFNTMMSMHPHPMHIHLVQFKIEGTSSTSQNHGWKDIINIPIGGSGSILAEFEGEPGIYSSTVITSNMKTMI